MGGKPTTTFGYYTSNDNNRKIVMTHILGKESTKVNDRPFDPLNREDLTRVYKLVGEEFVPAFPNAKDPDFVFPSEQDVVDIFDPKNGYLYFRAGEKDPSIFTFDDIISWNKAQTLEELKGKGVYKKPPVFAGGKNPRADMTSEQCEKEANRKEIDVFIKEAKRADEVYNYLYGTKLNKVGTDYYRTYDEHWVNNIKAKGGVDYPTAPVGSKVPSLSEDDIAALTMVNMARTDLHPQKFKFKNLDSKEIEEVTAYEAAEMNLDTLISRPRINTDEDSLLSIVRARSKTKDILDKYYGKKQGDADLYDGMAEALVKGLPVFASTCAHPFFLENDSIARAAAAKRTMNLLDKNPALLQAARIKADKLNVSEDFEKALRQCRTMTKAYDYTIAGKENELRLMNHEAGMLFDKNGNKVTLSDEEVKSLRTETDRRNVVSKILKYQTEANYDIDKERQEDFYNEGQNVFHESKSKYLEGTIADDDKTHVKQLLDIIRRRTGDKREVAPILEMVLNHEGGKEVVDHIIQSNLPDDKKVPTQMYRLQKFGQTINNVMLEQGLLPKGGIGDTAFDYDKVIDDYCAKHPEINEKRFDRQRNTDGYITSNEENRKTILNHVIGQDREGASIGRRFDPLNREDLSRIYRRNEQGQYVQMFPDALEPGFKGATEQQLLDIFDNDKGYIYYEAGKNVPSVFSDDTHLTKWAVSNHNPKRGQPEGQKNQPVFAAGTKLRDMTDEQLAAEENRKELDVYIKNAKRAENVMVSLYGTKLDKLGTDKYRNFEEQWVKNIKNAGGEEYPISPTVKGKPLFTEKEIAALSMINMMRTDINGGDIPGLEEAHVRETMANFETGTKRKGTNEQQHYIEPIVKGRKKTNEILTDFYSKYAQNPKNPALYDGLAESLAKGLATFAAVGGQPESITKNSIYFSYSNKLAWELLQNHPELVAAARKKASKLKLTDRFEQGLRQCDTVSKVYDYAIDIAEKKLRLANHEANLLFDENGNKIRLSDKEVTSLKNDIFRSELIDEMASEHMMRTDEMVQHYVDEATESQYPFIKTGKSKYVKGTVPKEKREEASALLMTVSEVKRAQLGTSPEFELVFNQKDGMEVLDDIRRRAKNPNDYNEIHRELIKNKLIPASNVSERKYKYESNIRTYKKKHPDMQKHLNEPIIELPSVPKEPVQSKVQVAPVNERRRREEPIPVNDNVIREEHIPVNDNIIREEHIPVNDNVIREAPDNDVNKDYIREENREMENNIPIQKKSKNAPKPLPKGFMERKDSIDSESEIDINTNSSNNINNINNINNKPEEFEINTSSKKSAAKNKKADDNAVVDTYGNRVGNEKNRKIIIDNMQGDKREILHARPFEPRNGEDLTRVYRKNKNGLYVQAFPHAMFPGFEGISEQETADILSPDKGYIYFPAGQKEPIVYDGHKQLLWQNTAQNPDHGKPGAEEASPLFAEGKNPRADMTPAQLKAEEKRKEIDSFIREAKRADEVYRRVYGKNLDRTGSENCRTYDEKWALSIKEQGGAARYPDPPQDGKYPVFSDDQLAALTMINMVRPDVIKSELPGVEEVEACQKGTMNIDTYLNRDDTNEGKYYVEQVVDGRNKTNEILTNLYAKQPNDAELYNEMADGIVKGLPLLAGMADNPANLRGEPISRCSVPKKVYSLLAAHPALAAAARKAAAAQNKSEEFETALRKCAVLSKLYDYAMDSAEKELRLAKNDAGLLLDEDGNKITLSEEEQDYLRKEVNKVNMFAKMASENETRIFDEVSDVMEYSTKLQAQIAENGTCEKMPGMTFTTYEEKNKAQSYVNSLHYPARFRKGVSPELEMAFLHNNGMEMLENIMEHAQDPNDYEEIHKALIDNHLIPPKGVNDLEFNYDRAIRDYMAKNVYNGLSVKLKQRRPGVRVADPFNGERLVNNHGFITSTEENRRKLLTNMYDVRGVSEVRSITFDPLNRMDVARLYRKNSAGVYCQAFPDAEKPGYAGLDEKTLMEVLDPKQEYAYFMSDKVSTPRMMAKNGVWMQYDTVHPELKDKLQFDKKGMDHIAYIEEVKKTDGDPKLKEQFARDSKIRTLDSESKLFTRAAELSRDLYGAKLSNVGTDHYQTYGEEWVSNLKRIGCREYPNPNRIIGRNPDVTKQPPVLNESDLVALTTLNLANPDVNGDICKGLSREGVTSTVVDMNLDTYTSRANTNTGMRFMTGIKNAREKTYAQLGKYYTSSVDDKKLYDQMGESLYKGIRLLTHTASHPETLGYEAASKLMYSRNVDTLTKRFPGILEAARKYADKQGRDKRAEFEDCYKRCQYQANLQQQIIRSLKAEQRLAEYEKGDLLDEYGRKYQMPESEEKMLRLEVKKRQALQGLGYNFSRHLNRAKSPNFMELDADARKVREQGKSDLIPDIPKGQEASTAEALTYEAAQKYRHAVQMAPVYDLIYSNEGGMKAFEKLLDTVELKGDMGKDAKVITKAMTDNGLIPEDNKPDQAYDYQTHIQQYNESPVVNEQAAQNQPEEVGMREIGPEQQAEVNAAPKEKSPEEKIIEEMGLSEEDIAELAANNHISAEQYKQRIVDEYRRANAEAQEREQEYDHEQAEILGKLHVNDEILAKLAEDNDTTVDEVKKNLIEEYRRAHPNEPAREQVNKAKTELGNIENEFKDPHTGKDKKLNGKELCGILKRLNSLSEGNKADVYASYRAGEMMRRVCSELIQYEKENPAFRKEKARYLKKDDLDKAKTTIRRADIAAKSMKMKMMGDPLKKVDEVGTGMNNDALNINNKSVIGKNKVSKGNVGKSGSSRSNDNKGKSGVNKSNVNKSNVNKANVNKANANKKGINKGNKNVANDDFAESLPKVPKDKINSGNKTNKNSGDKTNKKEKVKV